MFKQVIRSLEEEIVGELHSPRETLVAVSTHACGAKVAMVNVCGVSVCDHVHADALVCCCKEAIIHEC